MQFTRVSAIKNILSEIVNVISDVSTFNICKKKMNASLLNFDTMQSNK